MEKEIKKYIKESILSDKDKNSFNYLVDRIKEGVLDEFTDKNFVFEGDPGIGKTFFVKNFLTKLNIPIMYLGPFEFKAQKMERFNSLNDLMKKIDKKEITIIFIDDLNNSLEFEYSGLGEMRVTDSERKIFLKFLDYIRNKENNLIFFTTLNDSNFIEESWRDRLGNQIELEVPQERNKKIFLKDNYSKILNKKIIDEIARKSIGYSFRNLEDFIKICYREGKGKITRKIIYETFSSFRPSGLNYETLMNNNFRFNDIIGQDRVKLELNKLKIWLKSPKKVSEHGVKRSNIFIFSGKNGVGKTFMASALAGELNLMLVKINVSNIATNPFFAINDIINKARRFRNCIFFIDEVDKAIGRGTLDLDENCILGELCTKFDRMNFKPQGIIIFAVNNILRLGNSVRDRFKIIEFDMPSKQDREEYFKRRIEKSKSLRLNTTPQEIAGITEGYNFRDLEKLWDDIVFYYLDHGNFDANILNLLVSTQKRQEHSRGAFLKGMVG